MRELWWRRAANVSFRAGLDVSSPFDALDEPSLGLAPLLVRELYSFIANIRKEGVTILLVEQNATMALKVCDYVYLLETGVVKVQGIAEEVWSREDVKKFIWEDKYVFSGLFITADHEWSSFWVVFTLF